MTDQITQYVATKLSKEAKRGGTKDRNDLHGDKRLMDAVASRTAEELHRAQLKLAEMAMEQPDSQQWLSDVLEVLDLRKKLSGQPLPDKDLPCSPHTGTMRGYNMHLRGYTAACTECKNVAAEEERGRMAALGLTLNGDGLWTLSRS